MTLVVVQFHPRLPNDFISFICYYGGKLSRLPMGLFSHVSLKVDAFVYELTWSGIVAYSDKDFTRPVLDTISFDVEYEDLQKIFDRLITLSHANVRLSVIDLIRMVMRRKVKGLLCTDFVEIVMGYPPSHLTPFELFERFRYV